MTRRFVRKLLAPIYRRLAMIVTRGVVKLVDDGLKMQTVQVTGHADEVLDNVERWQQYGLTSRPRKGAEALLLAIGGHRAHTAAVAVDDRRYRPTDLEEGEVALYSDEGDIIKFKRGKIIEVVTGEKLDVTAPEVTVTAETKVTLDTPTVHCTGDLEADGEVSDGTGTMQDMRDTYNGHTHGGQVPSPTDQM